MTPMQMPLKRWHLRLENKCCYHSIPAKNKSASIVNAKEVLHNCEQSTASFFSLLLDDSLLSWMQNPQGAQGTEPLPPMSGCHLFSVWKEKHQSERACMGCRWRCCQARSGLCSQRIYPVRLTETKHIPILFATLPLPKESLCYLINVVCFQKLEILEEETKF